MNLELYNMEVSDLDAIANNLETDFDDFWNYNVFKSELENENSNYIVAKQNNIILGFAGVWKAVDDVHITNIVVRKDMRGNGIASIMLKELIKLTNELGYNSLTLEVNENNIPAIKLYEKFGFNKLGIRKRYYNNTDNAIIMTLSI